MNKLSLASLVGLGLLVGNAACSEEAEDAESSASALSSPTVLTCSELTVERGSIGRGQSAAALAVRDQSGRADDWTKYVELARSTSAVCSFRLPAGLTAQQVASLAVRLDYRGPSKREMPWTIEVCRDDEELRDGRGRAHALRCIAATRAVLGARRVAQDSPRTT